MIALVSPVDKLGEQLLFMHMVQHVLLLDIAPILLILGQQGAPAPVTRRLHAIERRAGYLAHPVFAVLLYVGFMWLWHIPAMYDAALHHSASTPSSTSASASPAALYWWHLLSPIRSRMRLGGLGPIAYMVSPSCSSACSGRARLPPDAIYPYYEHHPHFWGLSPPRTSRWPGS